MADHTCFIVPPHLLEDMAASYDEEIRSCATRTLAACQHIHQHRHDQLAEKADRRHARNGHTNSSSSHEGIVPDSVLEHLSQSPHVDDSVRKSANKSLALSQKLRADHDTALAAAAPEGDVEVNFIRGVYDMENQGDTNNPASFDLLPGAPVRLEGQPASQDSKVNEAYDNALKVLTFYQNIFNYNSLDNHNMPVVSSVHFSKDFGNAFWSSQKQQMVYGDGNKLLYNFTGCLDVIGHEMTHAVTSFNSGLLYQNESGALNEHISDVFGIMVKQMAENETADQADWLIGEGCLMPGVKGVSLRNMKNPGTAYNDPRFGADIQPAHYSQIPKFKETYAAKVQKDRGGVHLFSGIPNRAFCLTATAFGAFSWEKAGQVWWKTVTTNRIPAACTFLQFADTTVDVATELYGDDGGKIVRDAWNQVGVARTN